jgi:glycosyltransferase involved in cell wall biosynthesis
MRIGIDLRFLIPGRVGGSEMYTRNLIAALGRIDRHNHYHLFTSLQNEALFQGLPPNFNTYSNHYANISGELDLIHFPGTTVQSRPQNIPTVVTIHDLQHLYWPGFFSLRERLRRWRQDRPSIQQAARIIAISDFTRKTIGEKFPTAVPKTTTIHSGVAAEFFQPAAEGTKSALRQRYKLPDHFALYPAYCWPHKNHKRLFEAIHILKHHFNTGYRLVLSGFTPEETPADWRPLLDSLGGDTVQIVGYLPDKEMPILYQTADLLVFPSLFEGFGLPVLEAMAAGTAVICANIGSLLEIAGNAAVLVDPFDSFALAKAMHCLLASPDRREKLIENGRQQAQSFSWETTAKETLRVYHEVGR